MRKVSETWSNTVFVWVGSANPSVRNWLLHDLNSLGLRNHVVLAGHTDDVAAFYAGADVFILTSREDSFPSVILEAMANKLPVVLFQGATGIEEVVNESGAICVPYLDQEAMSTAIVGLLQDKEARQVRGARLRALIDRDFSQARYIADLFNIVKSLH